MPETFTDRLTAAFDYARTLHVHQVRKGTSIPYLSHLMAVAAIVMESGGDEDQVIASLLHDAVEDQGHEGRTKAEIAERWGERVAGIVMACTDAETVPKPPWRERKEKYLAHLSTAPVEVRRVVAADKLHNAQAILNDYRQLGDLIWRRFNVKAPEILWYYRAVVTRLREADSAGALKDLMDRLEKVVSVLEREVAVGQGS